MMTEYNELLIAVEVIIINHGLLDRYHFDEVKTYKFMTPELKLLKDELSDIYSHNEQPITQAIWDKYPTFYGKLTPKAHSSLKAVFKSAKGLKARVHTYNKLNEHIGSISSTGKPLEVIIDKIIADMQIVKGALNE